MCPKFKAKDPRDKVYALLGLVTDELGIKALVDYNKSTETVYTETARYLLGREPHPLRILTYAGVGLPGSVLSLPSWVPDWRNAPNSVSLEVSLRYTHSYKASGVANTFQAASMIIISTESAWLDPKLMRSKQ